MSSFGHELRCRMTFARGEFCGLRFRKKCSWWTVPLNHIMEVLPTRTWCMLSFRMLRCCSTIISGQCFWEEQPQAVRECRNNVGLKACCLEWLMVSTSWVIALDGYVINTICYVLRLGCCAAIRWGVGERLGCQYKPGPQSRWRKTQRKKQVNCISKLWTRWGEKKLDLHLKGYRAYMQAAEPNPTKNQVFRKLFAQQAKKKEKSTGDPEIRVHH